MATDNLFAIVASSSVIAAVIGQGIAEARERWHKHHDAGFAALYLAIALESYAGDCSNAIGESENHQSSDGHAGAPHGNIPDLPDFPTSIDWNALGLARTTAALSFQNEVLNMKSMIRDIWEWGDEDDAIPVVREEAGRLGTKALELAIALRAKWKIDPVSYEDDWNVKKYLAEKYAHYLQKRETKQTHARTLMGGALI